MNIYYSPRDDDAGYGIEEPAPQPKPTVSRPMDPAAYAPRSSTPPAKKKDAEWTEWKGLRTAVVSLLLRGLLAIVVWGGIVWALTPLIQMMAGRGRGTTLMGASIGGGVIVGIILSRGLADRAGFVSPILSAMACTTVVICIFAGSVAGSVPHGAVVFTIFPIIVASLAGGGMAVFKTVMDD